MSMNIGGINSSGGYNPIKKQAPASEELMEELQEKIMKQPDLEKAKNTSPSIQSHNFLTPIEHGPGPKVLATPEEVAAAGANLVNPASDGKVDEYI